MRLNEKLKRLLKNRNRRVARANKKFEEATAAEKRVLIAKDVLKQLATKKIRPKSGTWLAPTSGNFCTAPTVETWSSRAEEQAKIAKQLAEVEVQDLLKETKTCNACQLGALFACAVNFADKLKVKDLSDWYEEDGGNIDSIELTDIEKYLRRFFTKTQLRLMEIAFEHGYGGYPIIRLWNNEYHTDKRTVFTIPAPDYENVTFSFNRDEDGWGNNPGPTSVEKDAFYFTLKTKSPAQRMRMIMENVIENKGSFKPPRDPRSRQQS